MQRRTFVDQRDERGPGWRVERQDHVERMAGAPGQAFAQVTRELAAKHGQFELRVPVRTTECVENLDQRRRRASADLAVQQRPADLKGRDEIAIGPPRRPVLQPQIARRGSRILCFARRKRAPLKRTAGEQRVDQKCEFLHRRIMRFDVRSDQGE